MYLCIGLAYTGTLHRSKAGDHLERSVNTETRLLDQVDVDAGERLRDQAGENAIRAWPWHVLTHDDDDVAAGKIRYDFRGLIEQTEVAEFDKPHTPVRPS